MPDGFVKIRSGEKRPMYGQATAQTGTLTISGSPGPACTLYDSAGAVVGGFSGIATTGYDAGALANPRVWLNLDTAAQRATSGASASWAPLVD